MTTDGISPSPAATTRVYVPDPRAPAGRALLLAWDVTADGDGELATYLLRGADGAYVQSSRPDHASTLAGSVTLLSRERARAWYCRRGSRLAMGADAFPPASA